MSMKFIEIRDALIAELGAKAGTDFRVLGYQDPSKAADAVLDEARLVEVYYKRGDFPKSGGSLHGPCTHQITMNVDCTVGKASEGDLATLENESATAEQKSIALTEYKEAKQLADQALDELFEKVWQIIMAADNMDLKLPENVSSRWVPDMEKDDPVRLGQYIILTGSTRMECKAEEDTTGLIPEEGSVYEGEIRVEDDPNEGKAGVQVDNTP